jgi:hypothetical protein
MNKLILSGIIIAIIIGITSVLYTSTFLVENQNKGTKSTSGNSKESSEQESMPQGRNLTLEFDEKMGLSAP